ncbi:hypothetical protein [Photobacterium leiognathi]|nr:hypothetical protein [Photobacterium leiognathi]
MTQNKIIGIDLAKSIFYLFEINHKETNFTPAANMSCNLREDFASDNQR